MHIVNIGTDKSLAGGKALGDAVERHRQYGRFVDRLDIIVYSNRKDRLKEFQIGPNVIGHPTNSRSKLHFAKDAIRVFKRIHGADKVDLVICQDPFIPGSVGVRLKEKFGVKLQINFHGDFLDNPYWLREHWRHRYYRRLAERTIQKADTIRAVSAGIKEKLVNRGIRSEDIYVIPTPVNLERFTVAPHSDRSRLKIVLTVGRLVKAKDFPTLLQTASLVAAAVPGVQWRIIGDGPLRGKLRRQSRKLPTVQWLGQLPHEKLAEQYGRASVLVSTSTNESFGKVFLEAAMATIPSVATSTTGAKEIIRNGETGYLVPIGDVEHLAERIIYLLQNPDTAVGMGERAKTDVGQRFATTQVIERMVQMWKQTVGQGKN